MGERVAQQQRLRKRDRALRFERAPGAAGAPLLLQARATYERHRPERTPLYPLVVEHLETLLARACERTEHGFGYPRYVRRTFEAYLSCGMPQAGFCRVRCSGCGFERLVAFSCKLRGICPSCAARRMADTAAHLVDRVLPVVRYRQWVLALPFSLRLMAARDPGLRTEVLRILLQRVFAWQRRQARQLGVDDPRPAAVSFLHLFGKFSKQSTFVHDSTVGAADGDLADPSLGRPARAAGSSKEQGQRLGPAQIR